MCRQALTIHQDVSRRLTCAGYAATENSPAALLRHIHISWDDSAPAAGAEARTESVHEYCTRPAHEDDTVAVRGVFRQQGERPGMSSVLPYDILTLCSHAVLLLWRGTERSWGAPCPTDSNFLLRSNSRAASARGRVDAPSPHRDLGRGLSPRHGRRVHPHLVPSHAGQVLHLADGRARRPSADNKRAVCVRATPRLHGVASHGRGPSAIGPWERLLY